jgi:hypothetical protein
MKFHDFERFAREAYEEIPEAYKAGVDGLVVRRDAVPHPERPDVFTLGECLTEEHLSDYGSSETTRSVIALYWGSFRELARRADDFDWEEEAWETLTHELRHHLESLAGDDALEGVDYAADETFKRLDGEPFDPWYWQHGDEIDRGLYQVEKGYYLEQEWSDEAFEAAGRIVFTWGGRRYAVPRPEELGDVHFVLVDWPDGHTPPLDDADRGPADDPDVFLELVLVRRRSWWASLKRMLGASGVDVLESSATAEPAEGEG